MRTDRGALGRNACALRQSSAKFSSAVRTRSVVCYVRLVCGTFLLRYLPVGMLRFCSARRNETSRNVTSWWVLGSVELSSTTLSCSLGLPPHVGRGDAAVLRSTRSESFFDLITKLRAGLRLEFCRYAGVGGADASPSNR